MPKLPDQLAALTIVQAQPHQAGMIAELCAEHAAYEQIGYSAASHAERLAVALQAGEIHIWLACSGAAPVAYAAARAEFATLSASYYLHLDCLFVRPQWRNAGLGEWLLHAVRQAAQAKGCQALQWQTPAWNSDAIRFYRRQGAQALDKVRFYWPVAG